MLSSPGKIGPFCTYIFITVFIFPWDSCGVYCNYEELLQLLQNHDPVCICLQELILGSRFLPAPRGYISFISSIRSPHGRGRAVRIFYFTARNQGRRFLSVPRYMLWQYVFISVVPILFVLCIWLLVCRLERIIWLNCSVNSRSPSFSLVISISVTVL